MIIECPHCESKVDAASKGEIDISDPDYPFPVKVVLVECAVCKSPLLGQTEMIQVGENEWEWGVLSREWPAKESDINWQIPPIARLSLVEAKTCFKARAYSACAVMCGRTIEGVGKHHDPKAKTLAVGLKSLKENGVIDRRLFDWGEALRTHRNLGAHATTEKVSKEDAKDLLDFAIAICEYVFILNEKFERFRERQKNTN